MDEKSVFVLFNIANEWGIILVNWSDCLFGTEVSNTVDACW